MKVPPVHRIEIAKDAIYDTKSRFQVRIVLIVLRPHGGVFDGHGLEHRLVRFVADAFTLDGEVESLGAGVSLVP